MCIGNHPVAISDCEMACSRTYVDAMISVRGVPDDPFLFFVEGVHGTPGKRHPAIEHGRMGGQLGVFPGAVVGLAFWCLDGEPLCGPEVAVLRHPILGEQRFLFNVTAGEVGDRIAARFV
jgi:hypothetical protein